MTNSEYKLIPLTKTQSIPIHWEFGQEDYDKLTKGYRSNWCVFLRDDVVHVCRVGGEEFYRFALSKVSGGTYVANTLETYVTDSFYTSAKQRGWTRDEIEKHQTNFRKLAVEETAGLLATYFDMIKV